MELEEGLEIVLSIIIGFEIQENQAWIYHNGKTAKFLFKSFIKKFASSV